MTLLCPVPRPVAWTWEGVSPVPFSGTMNMWGCIGGLLAPWTIPCILEAAEGQWHTVILVIAGWYTVGAFCRLGIDPVTPVVTSRNGQETIG
jgi:hypothetical protein